MAIFGDIRRRIRATLGQEGDSDMDSDAEEIVRVGVERKLHSRRPPNTAFRQQRLKSWQPVFNSLAIRLLMLVVGLIFVGIGIGLVFGHKSIKTIEIQYGNCSQAGEQLVDIPSKYVHGKGLDRNSAQWKYQDGECTMQFESKMKGKVNLYYKLTNFYQNHRKYVDSFDWNQLKGQAVALGDLNSKCGNLKDIDGKVIYPCGLIANSMFNDTFSSPNTSWDESGIAWSSDVKVYKPSEYSVDDVVPPPNWEERYPDGYTEESLKAVSSDEHLMVWMKTAALPKFVKLWARTSNFEGQVSLVAQDNFPADSYGGTKAILLSKSPPAGAGVLMYWGLPIAFLISGSILLIFGVLFSIF